MIYYGVFNKDGFPIAFYNTEINEGNIPSDAIQLTDDQWLEFINNSGQRIWKNGQVIEYIPPVVPTPIPEQVTAAQAQVALYNAGLLDDVEQIIETYPYPMVRIWWRAASYWRRDNPYVQGLALELGLTEKQVDDLFVAAAAVQT